MGSRPGRRQHREWIKSHVRFEQAALEATLADYLEEVDHVAERIVKLEKAMDEAVRQAPPKIRAVIEAFQALRGVAQTTAATIVCELGSVSRFQSPRQLMGYSGLVAREHSSGNRVQRGGITKTGNGHLRRVLVEAAWAYQHRPNVIGFCCAGKRTWPSVRRPKRSPGKRSSGCINATKPWPRAVRTRTRS